MRADMARVLVERPRAGLRQRLKRRKLHQLEERIPSETALARESMSRGRGTKYLSENLSPLIRYLRSQVGRPWNAVYSEISERLRPTSAVQQHVRDHLRDFVVVHTWLEGRKVMGQTRWDGIVALSPPSRGCWVTFYVDPRSGFLRERPLHRRGPSPTADPLVRWEGPDRQLRCIDGIWYRFDLVPIPQDAPLEEIRDCILGRPLAEILRSPRGQEELQSICGRPGIFAAAKRQLSKRELKALRAPSRRTAGYGGTR